MNTHKHLLPSHKRIRPNLPKYARHHDSSQTKRIDSAPQAVMPPPPQPGSLGGERVKAIHFQRLTILVFIAFLVPALVFSFTPHGESSPVLTVRTGLILIATLYSSHILLGSWRENAQRIPTVVIGLVLLMSARQFVEFVHREGGLSSLSNLTATAIISWALWSLRPRVSWFRIIGVLAMLVALLSITMASVTPDVAFMMTETGTARGAYKSVSGNGLLAGPFANSNTLGAALVLSIPFIFLWDRRTTRALLLIPTVIALWMTVARTSLIAGAIVVSLYILLRQKNLPMYIKKFTVASTLLAAILILTSLPFLNKDPEFLTGRGYIWQVDLAGWNQSRLFGLGSSWHSGQSVIQAGSITVTHTSSHNLLVSWLTFGGFVFALFSAWIVFLLIRKSWLHLAAGIFVPVLYVIGLLITGISESSWQIMSMTPSYYLYGYLISALLFSRPRTG